MRLPVLFLLCLWSLPVLALPHVHRIETIPADPRPGQGLSLRISGEWPNGCPLEPQAVLVDGAEIEVYVRAAQGFCAEVIQPYALLVDVGAQAPAGFPQERTYRVRYGVQDGGGKTTILGFRLIGVQAADARRARPEPGFWSVDEAGGFPTPQSGLGFMLESQGNSLAITTNSYLMGGQPAWYLAAGTFEGRVFRSDLLRTFGGQPLFGSHRGQQGVQEVGRLDAEFLDDARAIFWYSQASGEGLLDELLLMPVSVRRMNFALGQTGEALAGTWVYTGAQAGSRVQAETFSFAYVAEQSNSALAVLVDSARGAELRCTLDPLRADGPPRHCELSLAQAGSTRLDHTALNRLSGSSEGAEVVLLRIDGR